jgi:hypothetical protein
MSPFANTPSPHIQGLAHIAHSHYVIVHEQLNATGWQSSIMSMVQLSMNQSNGHSPGNGRLISKSHTLAAISSSHQFFLLKLIKVQILRTLCMSNRFHMSYYIKSVVWLASGQHLRHAGVLITQA